MEETMRRAAKERSPAGGEARASATARARLQLCVATTMMLAAYSAATAPVHADALSKPIINLGSDAVGQSCFARRMYGDPLAGRGERAYELICGGMGGVPLGRLYLFDTGRRADAQTSWRAAVAEQCVGPTRQPWEAGSNLTALESTVCAGEASGRGSARAPGRTALMLLAAGKGQLVAAGDAVPVAGPALERGIRILLGAQPEPEANAVAGPRSPLMDAMQAALGQDIAGGSSTDFETSRRVAYESNALWLFEAAERQFADAIRIHASLWPNDQAGRADLMSERALNLANQRRFGEALSVIEAARAGAASSGQALMQAKVEIYAAMIELDQGRREAAAAEARKGIAGIAAWRRSRRTVGASSDGAAAGLASEEVRASMLEAQAQRALGAALRRSDPAGARAAADAARAIASRLDPRLTVWLRTSLAQDAAEVAIAAGKPAEAIAALDAALADYRGSAVGTRIEGNLLMSLGSARRAAGDDAGAATAFRTAFQIFRQQPENRGVSALRAMPYLDLLAEQLARRPDDRELAREAFAAFETIANPAVAQGAAASAARLVSGEQGAVVRESQDADRALRRAQARLAALPPTASATERQAAETETTRRRAAAEQLQRAVAIEFPRYNLLTLEPVELDELASTLGPEERFVRIALGDTGGFGMLVSPNEARMFRVDLGEAEAAELTNKLKTALRDRGARFPAAQAHLLHQKLFAHVEAGVWDDASAERLIVDVQGPLAALPFGVLLTDPGKGNDPAGASWLLKRFAVVNSPGARALVTTRKMVAPGGQRAPFLGFGGFSRASSRAADQKSGAQRIIAARKLSPACEPALVEAMARFQPLDDTRYELEIAAETLGASDGAVVIGPRFTDAAVADHPDISRARIIAFATHGVFGSDFAGMKIEGYRDGCIPDAALLTSDPGAEGTDIFLDTSEVLNLKLDADLVVLSACDTGNAEQLSPGETGLPSGGDELSGLARAFFYAGARSVLVTHWAIPSEETQALMASFYERMAAGASPSKALRDAQLERLSQGEAPYGWGAFALIASPRG